MRALSQPIQSAELNATVTVLDQGLLVRLSGTADLRVTETVEKLLAAVHEQATAGHVAEVKVDLRSLEFMNSSCFKSFVSWISQVQELAESAQYRIHFYSNPAILWQRRSLNALSCFAAHLVTIDSTSN
jgi:anti-anti-sigma regulatory factor